jgi:uncharacterized protein (TIGR02996 family)
MNAITSNINGIVGEFSCTYGGIRTEKFTHDWSKDAGGVISESPADVTEWLALADRLDDEGNPAAHMIRALFTEGYQPPATFRGEMSRGGNYHESGSNYTEGVSISWVCDDGFSDDYTGFRFHYWSGGGNCYRNIDRAEAVQLIARKGGARVSKWYNLRVVGSVRGSGLMIPAGTVVIVSKLGSNKAVAHTTETNIPIPGKKAANNDAATSTTERKHTYHSWGGIESPVIVFAYMGYEITVLVKDVESIK